MRINHRYIFILSIFGVIVAIEGLVAFRIISPFILSRPSQILIRLTEMFVGENLAGHVFQTTFLSLISSVIGFLIGIIIAVLMISLSKTKDMAEFLLDFFRSIPLTTLVPIFIAIYGIGNSPKVAIGAVSSSLTTAITLYLGLKDIREIRKDFLSLYCPRFKTTLLKIYFKDGQSLLFTSFRLCISISLVLIVVCEMFIGTENGVGKLIMDKSFTDDRAGQYATIFTIGIIGWLFNKIITIVQSDKS